MHYYSYFEDHISLAPFRKDAEGYSWGTFQSDVMAAIAVAFLTLPQAMASAMLAGLPLSCGLFAAIYSSFIAAFFGSSRHLVVGPSNAIAILIQLGTAQILFTYYRDLTGMERDVAAMQVLTQLTILVAVFQIIAAWCRLGRLTQFVSYSVVIGYIVGAAIAVVINQLFVFLGIPRMEGIHSLYENGVYLVTHLYQTQWFAAIIGIGSFLLLLTLKRMNIKISAAVITLAAASILVEMLGFSSYSSYSWLEKYFPEGSGLPQVMLVGDTAEFYDIIPSFTLPFLNMRIMNGVLPVAFALALLSILETTSVAKAIAANSGQRLSVNQEIFGLGLGNLVSAFTGAMPISGSPLRSSINYQNGAQTRFSAVLTAGIVILILFILGIFVTRIPLSALAALLLATALSIVSWKQVLVCVKSTSADALVLWATLLSCLFFSLDIGFYIGVILSITLYLKKAAIPQLVEYAVDEAGDLRHLSHTQAHESRSIRVIKVEGELFFGAADLFQTTLKAIAEDDTSTRIIILQLKNARDIDATVCLALQQLHEYLEGSKRFLVACGMTQQVWEVLSNSGLVELIGRENLFAFDEHHPHLHMQKAFARAKFLAESVPYNASGELHVTSPMAPAITQ